MPWSNVPRELWPRMERCVAHAKSQGHDERSANAICYSSVVGKGVHKAASDRKKGGK